MFICFVWISEQTAVVSLYSGNGLVFIIETMCVYCAVGAEFSNIISGVRSQVIPCEICGGKRGTWTGVFSQYFSKFKIKHFT
jgi:hypothetical protein